MACRLLDGRIKHSAVGVVLVVAALVFAWQSPLARADGDPASDYLLTQQVFWRHYEIAVNVVHKRIGSTKINYITHTEAAFVVDASGHERALFLWPFYPQDVERVLRNLT